jgi:hypothetical protein
MARATGDGSLVREVIITKSKRHVSHGGKKQTPTVSFQANPTSRHGNISTRAFQVKTESQGLDSTGEREAGSSKLR